MADHIKLHMTYDQLCEAFGQAVAYATVKGAAHVTVKGNGMITYPRRAKVMDIPRGGLAKSQNHDML